MDLLPLYLSGEASADSRALIVAFLAQDPELAERIRAEPQDLFRNAAQPQLPADLL
jgi:anti-sigma factor RsiW